MENKKELTAEEVLGKNMLSLSKTAMELWGFECRQGMRKNILLAMQEYSDLVSSPLQKRIKELEEENEKLKGFCLDGQIAQAENEIIIEALESQAKELAEALEEILPILYVEKNIKLVENALKNYKK